MKDTILYYLLTIVGRPALNVNVERIDEESVLTGVLNTVYAVAGIVAVIAIIGAGFFYVTSQGGSEGVKKAKNTILYAVIGLVVVIMAFSITWFVSNRLV